MAESSAARLSRLLALVPWLMQHDGVTLAECAGHFGVTETQLQEDLTLLIVCGRPGYGPDQLVDIQFWDDDFEIHLDEEIHVVDPQSLGHPLRLSHEEALTILVALRMLEQIPGVEGHDAIVSAAVKLETATRATDAARSIAIRTGVADDVRTVVDQALRERLQLAITYAAGTRDEVTERSIDPLAIHTVDGVSYLEAYCHLAEALRTFRLDRILGAAVEGPRSEVGLEAPGDSPSPTPDSPDALTAVLDLEPAARWVVDVHGAVATGSGEGNALRVQLPLLTLDWGARLVLSLAGQARVVSPDALIEAVGSRARAALASYP